MDVREIDSETYKMIADLGLPRREQANPYVVLSVRGDGDRAPESWTATVYRNAKGRLKLVTSDDSILRMLVSDGLEHGASVDGARVLQIDDSGWGFPLGGVMIGATDGFRVETGLIETKYFQDELFSLHSYLPEAAHITLQLVRLLGGRPGSTRVEICPGYVNSESRKALEREGYETRTKEITGLLQNELERRFKEYVMTLGYQDYYDPKAIRSPTMAFDQVIRWIDEDPAERLKIAKTGWKYFKKRIKPDRPRGHGA
ncbi:MAG TPA: hypothetical protein VK436_06565 [Methanocella sp.]|nr:hypothetical protein [Methanocella sp.]